MFTEKEYKEKSIQNFINNSLKKGNYTNPVILGTPTIEEIKDTVYVYFEYTIEGMTKGMKRYYKLVFNPFSFVPYYENSNVIDEDKFYTIEDVKSEFKNFVKHLYDQIN